MLRNRSGGFTLAEIAVAFAIVALLLAGAMIPLRTQLEVRNTSDTQRTMEQIKEAVIGFALANGRLPCPAAGSTASGVLGAGTEQLAGNFCATAFGVIPWATLGVPEVDSWGRRFSYRVAPAFADALAAGTWATASPPSPADQSPPCVPTPLPSASSFALCTLGDMGVWTRSESLKIASPLGTALPAVLISHGRNGYGAWQTNGTRLNPIPAGNDEAANLNGTTTAVPPVTGGYLGFVFYSRNFTPDAGGCVDPAPGAAAGPASLCEFDDIVAMIPAPVLIARMVAAGRLP